MRLRSAQVGDYETLRTLWRQTFPELRSPGPDPADVARTGQVVVGEIEGEEESEAERDLVAWATIAPMADEADGRRVQVMGASDLHWAQLHDRLVERLRAEGIRTWYFVVREDCREVRDRLESRGYAVLHRSWGAWLELTDATDPERYRALLAPASAAGYDFRELDSGDARAAHRLYAQNRPDFPSTPSTEPDQYTEEEFAELITSGRAFGAWNADRLCALTVMRQRSSSGAGTEFTVTDRAERGRGLATAVKACGILTLWQEGVREFGTGGAEVNEASLKANLKLGYEIEPLWLTYGRVTGTPARPDHPASA